MDGTRFDRLARAVGARRSRRQMAAGLLATVGTVLAAGPAERLLGPATAEAAPKRRRRGKRKATIQAEAQAGLRDCPRPGPGQNLSKCDFTGQNLAGKNLRGANLSGALLAYANLCSADLRGANLHKTNLTHAYLTRADFRGTKLSSAILEDAEFCQTRLPNGKLDNRDCPPHAEDICCNDTECAAGTTCQSGVCGGPPPGASRCVALGNICDATTLFGDPCCGYNTGGVACTLTIVPGVGTCQIGCNSDAECKQATGSPDVVCEAGANCFLSPFRKCCFRRRTDNPASCASGNSCRFGNIDDREFECCLPGETCDLVLGCV